MAESGAGWWGMAQCHLIYIANANCSINWSKCAATSGRLGEFSKWPPPLYHINFLPAAYGRSVRCQGFPGLAPSLCLSFGRESRKDSELSFDYVCAFLCFHEYWKLLIDLSRDCLWMSSGSLNNKRRPKAGHSSRGMWGGGARFLTKFLTAAMGFSLCLRSSHEIVSMRWTQRKLKNFVRLLIGVLCQKAFDNNLYSSTINQFSIQSAVLGNRAIYLLVYPSLYFINCYKIVKSHFNKKFTDVSNCQILNFGKNVNVSLKHFSLNTLLYCKWHFLRW